MVNALGLILLLGIFSGISLLRAQMDPPPACPPTKIPTSERNALIALYASTNGDNWTNKYAWLDDGAGCSWWGVFCLIVKVDVEVVPGVTRKCNFPFVEFIDLTSNNLIGSIPPELGHLSNLRRLRLSGNWLTGRIPPDLGQLSNLEILEIFSNQLTGSIPPELGQLSNLEILDIFNNQLTGRIPPELGQLSNLEILQIFQNQLTGGIPPELGRLSRLQRFELLDNRLTGSIPPELGQLSNLRTLYLSDNQLTGSIPPKLGQLSNLELLWLNRNLLTGIIPRAVLNLPKLISFLYDDNLLLPTGRAPVIQIVPVPVNFGEALVGETAEGSIEKKNVGDESLRVENVQSGNSRFRVLGGSFFSLLPGQARTLELLFVPDRIGFLASELTIASNDPDLPRYVVRMEGEGVASLQFPSIRVQPEEVDFSLLQVGQQEDASIIVANSGDSSLDVTSVTQGLGPFQLLNAGPFAVEAGGSRSLKMRFAPTQPGSHTAVLAVRSNDPVSPNLSVRLTGTAEVAGTEPLAGFAWSPSQPEEGGSPCNSSTPPRRPIRWLGISTTMGEWIRGRPIRGTLLRGRAVTASAWK